MSRPVSVEEAAANVERARQQRDIASKYEANRLKYPDKVIDPSTGEPIVNPHSPDSFDPNS
jgi:hypothetical protein